MGNDQYPSGPASLFASAARAHWVGKENDQLAQAKAFLAGKKVITTQSFREGLGIDIVTARQLMSELEQAGWISGNWDFFKGGYPVLRQDVSTAEAV